MTEIIKTHSELGFKIIRIKKVSFRKHRKSKGEDEGNFQDKNGQ